jgi:hypothetical protein
MFCGGTFCSTVVWDWPAFSGVSLLQKKKKSSSLEIQETNVLRCHILLDIMTLVIGA